MALSHANRWGGGLLLLPCYTGRHALQDMPSIDSHPHPSKCHEELMGTWPGGTNLSDDAERSGVTIARRAKHRPRLLASFLGWLASILDWRAHGLCPRIARGRDACVVMVGWPAVVSDAEPLWTAGRRRYPRPPGGSTPGGLRTIVRGLPLGCRYGAQLAAVDAFVEQHATNAPPRHLYRLAADFYETRVRSTLGGAAPAWSPEAIQAHYEACRFSVRMTRPRRFYDHHTDALYVPRVAGRWHRAFVDKWQAPQDGHKRTTRSPVTPRGHHRLHTASWCAQAPRGRGGRA